MSKFLTIALLIFFSSNPVFSSEKNTEKINVEDIEEIPRNYIGFSASTVSSIGISYTYLAGESPIIGLKSKFFFYPNKYSSNEYLYFMGEELQISLYSSSVYRLYEINGLGLCSNLHSAAILFIGVALGNEFIMFNTIAINFDLGISIITHSQGSSSDFAPGVGFGLSYAF